MVVETLGQFSLCLQWTERIKGFTEIPESLQEAVRNSSGSLTLGSGATALGSVMS